jgi:N-acetylglutamate synthase-like GNAT family acetyltransferase
MKIRGFQKKDTKEVALLAMKTFEKYNGSDYFEKEGIQKTIDAFNPKKNSNLSDDFKKTPIFYVAEENNKIVGMVRGTINKLTSLFVDGREHKKGIGKQLVDKFENEAKRKGSKQIKLNASLHATYFYQKMGYKKSTGIRNFKGLKVYPMKKVLN